MKKRKWPLVSNNLQVQRHYEECREAGSNHKLSEMLALRCPPSLQTDTRWLSGNVNGSQFADQPAIGSYYKSMAESQGVDTSGAVYKSQLARYPGDPRAWVRSRSDCRQIAAERGMTLEGSVSYKPSEADVPNPLDEEYKVSDSIVDHEYEVLCDTEPDAAAMAVADVKAEIRSKLSPKDKD